MIMKVSDFVKVMEEIAPVNLKESYDNVGLMVGSLDKEVSSILVALDCTLAVIEEAKQKKCNLIFTHHPLLFKKPETITGGTLVGRKIIELISHNINLYSSHTNLDSAFGGLNDIIATLLGYEDWKVLEPKEDINITEFVGIGRLIDLKKPSSLISICESVKNALNISCLKYTGEDSKIINKIAIVNGSGEDFYELAKKCGADLIITGDTKYHNTCDYEEMGLAVIDAGHFETEWPSMKIFSGKLKSILNKLGYDNDIIISNASKALYKFI